MSENTNSNSNNEENITEQKFLEMAKDCMERINQKNQEIKEVKKEKLAVISKIIEIYGCYKKLSKYIYHLAHMDSTIDFLIREIDADLHELIVPKPSINLNFDVSLNIETLPDDSDDDDIH